jgi:hypothetical protein
VVTLTDKILMEKVGTKYAELVERNKFKGSTQKDDTIVTLQAQVQSLNSSVTQLKRNSKSDKHNDVPSGGTEREPSRREQRAKWIKVAPKDGEPKSKTVEGKTFHWCEGNGAHEPKWVIHEPSKCSGLKDASSGTEKTPPSSESNTEKRKVGWSTTMLATLRAANKLSDDEPDE